jgi:methyl-accepting chemotaxis protein
MKKMSIKSRLILSTFTSLILVAIIGCLALYQLKAGSSALVSIYNNNTVPLSQLAIINSTMASNTALIQTALLNAESSLDTKKTEALNLDAAEAESTADAVANNVETVTKTIDAYLARNLTPEEKTMADTFVASRIKYRDEGLKPCIAALRANDYALTKELVTNEVQPLYFEASKNIDALIQLQIDTSKKEYKASVARFNWLFKAVLIFVLASIVGGLTHSLLFARNIGRLLGGEPVEAQEIANNIANGDLTSAITVKAGDNTSLMARISAMQNNLRTLIAQIQSSAESISSGAQQISAGNTNLSQRTEEQASSLEETASSMEQMASTVKQNAENAKQANIMANEASQIALKGGHAVGQVVSTMFKINTSSKKIVDIIGVIDSIAFQTNILALNAAVEAARAGEQGRGFAVVATEVRNLAQRSASAAKEIKKLINDSVEKVNNGTELAADAAATMDEIVMAVKMVTDIVNEIAAASLEQSAGIDQVNNAITNMDEVTQQNAALVEEAAAAASSLESKAQELTTATSQFRLGADGDYQGGDYKDGDYRAVEQQEPNPQEVKAARAELPSNKPAKASSRLKPPKATKNEEWEEF